jgi:hypothetical protein
MWDDEKFRALTAGEKLTAIYIVTAQSNRCGLFVYSHALAMDHLGIENDRYRKAFANVVKTLGWMFDETARVIYIPTWWKYNPPENPKHLQGCLSDLHDIPRTSLLGNFRSNTTYIPDWENQRRSQFGKLVDTYGIAMPYQEQEQEQEQEQKQPAASAAAVVAKAGKTPEVKADADTTGDADPQPTRQIPAGDYHAIVGHFKTGWETKYPGCTFAFAKTEKEKGRNGAHFRWILDKLEGDLARAKATVDAYLANDAEFIRQERHPVGLLVSGFNKFQAPKAGVQPTKVIRKAYVVAMP